MALTPSILVSRHKCNTSTLDEDQRSGLTTSMAIPGARDLVPPPLPPPVFIPDIENGHDISWRWGNDPSNETFGRLASVRPGSSLLGEGLRRQGQEHESNTMQGPFDRDRRHSSTSTVTAGLDQDVMDDSLREVAENGVSSIQTSNTEYVVNIVRAILLRCVIAWSWDLSIECRV